MHIKRTEVDKKGVFEAVTENKIIGKMIYKLFGISQLIIEHTEVNPEFKGQGMGMKILLAVVDYARENNLRIIPICPYAKKMFEKHPELGDVLSGNTK